MIQILATISAYLALAVAIYFQFRSERKFRQMFFMLDNMKEELQKAINEYDRYVKEFLQFQGLRAYLRQALDLYAKAERRVISVARVWFVSDDLESVLRGMVAKPNLEIDFCGPVELDSLFPPLLWRLHLVYRQNRNSSRIRFWAMKDLPIRFTISDDSVLIAGAPPSRIPEETFGWQYGDKVAADFYTNIFTNMLKPHCQSAEETLISELKRSYRARVPIRRVIDAIVAGVFQKEYEARYQQTWGRKITAIDFEKMLAEWLCSLPVRHSSLVKIEGDDIEFT